MNLLKLQNYFLIVGFPLLCGLSISTVGNAKVEEKKVEEYKCPGSQKLSNISRAEVYKGMPFQSGESSEYEVSYLGVKVGSGTLKTLSPIMYNGAYVRSFSGEAKTADWYKYTYVVHDKVRAFSRPQDFGILKFYMNQHEGSMFGKPFAQEKWLDFDHDKCFVKEKTKKADGSEKIEEFQIHQGALDSFAVVFYLRTLKFVNRGDKYRVLVYSSEENWWLDAEAVAFEDVKVTAGTYKAVKLKLQTYIGKDLQQKGDVNIWIATEHPNKPMIKVEADIKIGSINMELKSFIAGK